MITPSPPVHGVLVAHLSAVEKGTTSTQLGAATSDGLIKDGCSRTHSFSTMTLKNILSFLSPTDQVSNSGHPDGKDYACSDTVVKDCRVQEPCIIFQNNTSQHLVSFSVAREDRLPPDECKRARGSLLTYLNEGLAKSTGSADVLEDFLFLMIDARLAPLKATFPTKVYFPIGCQNLRVFAFYRENTTREWQLYKESVYSIASGDKVFKLTAVDPLKRYDNSPSKPKLFVSACVPVSFWTVVLRSPAVLPACLLFVPTTAQKHLSIAVTKLGSINSTL